MYTQTVLNYVIKYILYNVYNKNLSLETVFLVSVAVTQTWVKINKELSTLF